MALTTDAPPMLEPAAPGDEAVLAGFALDQARDKGFGPALGAAAPDALAACAARHGYAVESAPSDWHIAAADTAMLEAMLGFLAGGACAALPDARDDVENWHAARRADVAARRLGMRIGHRDVLAYRARSMARDG